MPALSANRRYVSIPEAAEILGVNPRTVRRWIVAGLLTGFRFGPKLLKVDLDELTRFGTPVPTAQASAR